MLVESHVGRRSVCTDLAAGLAVSVLRIVPALLVAGDVGTVLGHVVGWYEWFTRPDYRRAYYDYGKGCPPDQLHIIER